MRTLTFIAVLTDPEPIAQIPTNIGEPSSPPSLHPARGPPQAEFAFELGAPNADQVAQEASSKGGPRRGPLARPVPRAACPVPQGTAGTDRRRAACPRARGSRPGALGRPPLHLRVGSHPPAVLVGPGRAARARCVPAGPCEHRLWPPWATLALSNGLSLGLRLRMPPVCEPAPERGRLGPTLEPNPVLDG